MSTLNLSLGYRIAKTYLVYTFFPLCYTYLNKFHLQIPIFHFGFLFSFSKTSFCFPLANLNAIIQHHDNMHLHTKNFSNVFLYPRFRLTFLFIPEDTPKLIKKCLYCTIQFKPIMLDHLNHNYIVY